MVPSNANMDWNVLPSPSPAGRGGGGERKKYRKSTAGLDPQMLVRTSKFAFRLVVLPTPNPSPLGRGIRAVQI